jgi:hypothetical protein
MDRRSTFAAWLRIDSPIQIATAAPISQSAIKIPISAMGRPVPVIVMRPLCFHRYANAQMRSARNEKSLLRFRSRLSFRHKLKCD